MTPRSEVTVRAFGLPALGPSAHLSWQEIACHDLARTPYPARWRETRARRLAALFERIRAECGDQPLMVLSGYRTPAHNRAIGGARYSQHVEGRALDLRPPVAMALAEFHARIGALAAAYPLLRGIGYYPAHGFVHVDCRPSDRLVRWTGAGAKDST